MIAIIDYDAGNIKSVEKALIYLGQEVEITRSPERILGAEGVILPGVGACRCNPAVCGQRKAFFGNLPGAAAFV